MSTVAHQTGNRLLDALPEQERDRILAKCERKPLVTKQLLIVEQRPIERTYFPLNCVLSMLARTDPDNFIEVATIGREGMLGIALLLGTETMPHRAFCQIPGDCLTMSADDFRSELKGNGPFVLVLHRYLQMLMVQLAQCGACNSGHSVEQRCARWLLMSRDRVDADEFPLTQAFLCQMLGVRRATVSEVASKFQKAGLLQYTRGVIRILNREALASVACDCYRILRDEYDGVLLPTRTYDQFQSRNAHPKPK